MTALYEPLATILTVVLTVGALATFVQGIRYFYDRKSFEPQMDQLRRDLEDLAPTDPQYKRAKQLYAAAVVDAHSHSLRSHAQKSSHNGESKGEADTGGSDGGGSD